MLTYTDVCCDVCRQAGNERKQISRNTGQHSRLPKPNRACYGNTTHIHAHVHTYTKTHVIEYYDLYETLSHMHVCKPRVHIVSGTQMFKKLVGKIVNETKIEKKKDN